MFIACSRRIPFLCRQVVALERVSTYVSKRQFRKAIVLTPTLLEQRIKKCLYACNENCTYILVTTIMDCRYHTRQTLIFLVNFQMFQHYNAINQFHRRNIIIT